MLGKYDIFISYRRNGGESLAFLLCERLKRLGYNVFYDVESLRNGKFNEKIYEIIDECSDVIAVLPENGLNRCKDENDWVRKELSRSIVLNKNIVPVLMRNFKFPSDLPDELLSLPNYNGVNANMEYFDATFDKLLSMLISAKYKKSIKGDYYIYYYTFSPILQNKLIVSKLAIDEYSHLVLYANVKDDNVDNAEYKYCGDVFENENNIYLRCDNADSPEIIYITLMKNAGSFDRYLGIISGLSSTMLPVSFKCACLPKNEIKKVNEKTLEIILKHDNREWNENVLAIESLQANLFYSEALFGR